MRNVTRNQDRNVLRFQGRFQSRNVTMYPSRFQRRNVTRFPDKNVIRFQDRCAHRFLNRNVVRYQESSVARCQDSPAPRFPSRSVVKCPSRNVTKFQGRNVVMYQRNSVARFPRKLALLTTSVQSASSNNPRMGSRPGANFHFPSSAIYFIYIMLAAVGCTLQPGVPGNITFHSHPVLFFGNKPNHNRGNLNYVESMGR